MRTIQNGFVITFMLLFFALNVPAQKVGLVLSGGGARGLAHIGVIKALEENNIPIDYITGTSMGAIVGALYASGYSPEMMEQIVTSEDFKYWSNGKIPEKYYYFFKQPSVDPSWVSMKFRWDSIFQASLPTNLISPVQMDLAFIEIFSRSNALAKSNFDSLFIPFRCVASDIEAGKVYVPQKASLAQMVRASMTIPLVFKPILIDNKLMFDGGIYNNFPADVMLEQFKPDVIIGSQVVTNFDPPDPNDIMTQIENMIVSRTNFDIIIDSGVLLKPKVQDVSILNFERSKEMIDIGYNTTIENIELIKQKINRRVDRIELAKKRFDYNNKLPRLLIDNIYIKGLTPRQSKYVYKLLTKKADVVSFDDLKIEYLKIIADDKIASIYPRVEYNSDTHYFDLYLDVERDKKFMAEIGGNMSSSASSQAYVGMQYKAFNDRSLSLFGNVYFSKFYMSSQLKTRIDFPYKLPFYLEADFTLNRWDYFKSSGAFFQNVRPSYLVQNEQHTAINLGFPAKNKGKFVGGFAQGYNLDEYYHNNNFAKEDTTDKTKFTFATAYFFFERNTLNRKQYANSGTYLKASLKYLVGKELNQPGSTSLLNAEERYNHTRYVFKFVYDNYFKQMRKVKFGFFTEEVFSLQNKFNNYTATLLQAPSFIPTPDSKTMFLEKFRSFNYASVGFKAIWLLNQKFNLRLEGYCFQPYKEILRDNLNNAYFGKAFNTRHWIASMAAVYHTPLGPVSISFNLYDNNYKSHSLLFNFGYIMFNEKVTD
ncbi:MAG: patatin-like phospholipase family protein [Bacteroidota bacterium]